jgi:hypothetical protein
VSSLLLVTLGIMAIGNRPAQAATSPSVNTPIVMVLMENKGYPSIVGSPNAPYINGTGQFACGGSNPGLLCGTQFSNFFNPEPSSTAQDGNTYPSLPAYIELTSADLSTFTAANCGGSLSSPDSCFMDASSNVIPADNPQENLIRQLETAGLPNAWGAYAEGMASNCKLHNNGVPSTGGTYATRHFPVVYYGDVTGPCASKAVPYVKGIAPDPNNLPQFSFIAPDTCSDMHDMTGCIVPTTPTDCTGTTGTALQICIGDDWLANNVPQFLSKALVLVTWDEDRGESGNNNRVLLAMTGVGVTGQSNNTASFTFDGLLHALQNYWGQTCIGGDGTSLYGHTPGTCSATPVPIPTPSLTSFVPTSGVAGTSVTITGTNFTGATAVTFGGTAASFTVDSAATITAAVPPGTATGPIAVLTPKGTSTSTTDFVVTPGIAIAQHVLCKGHGMTPACSWPGATQAGDLLIAAIGVPGSPRISGPSGYGQAENSRNDAAIYFKSSSSDSGSVTFTLSAARNWVVDLVEVSGIAGGGEVDQHARYSSGSASVSTIQSGTTVATAQANEFAFAVLFDASAVVGTNPTNGYAFIDADSQGSSNWTGFVSSVLTSTGTQSTSAGLATAAKARGAIATFRGA